MMAMRPAIWTLLLATIVVGIAVLWPSNAAQSVGAMGGEPASSVNEFSLVATPDPSTCLQTPSSREIFIPQGQAVGRVGLFVARFEPGEKDFNPSQIVQLRSGEVFPMASNYKISVLWELLRQVDQGRVSLLEKFDVTRQNQSLGDYPFDHSDVPTLASRMIHFSDNTATDILHSRVGIGSLQHLADDIGLCQTRLILPTKAWWAAEAGLGGPDFPKDALFSSTEKFAKADVVSRVQIATRLYGESQKYRSDYLNSRLNPFWEGRYDWEQMAKLDRNLQNASTPLEWASFVWASFNQSGLSPTSERLFRKIMSTGYGKRMLKISPRYFGGKNGNTAGVLGFTGYIEAQSGARFVYVYLSDTVPEIFTLRHQKAAFSLINKALDALGAK